MNWCHTRDCMYVSYHSYQRVQRLVNQCEFVRPSSGIPAMAHLGTSQRSLDAKWCKISANRWLNSPEDHVLDCGHMPSKQRHHGAMGGHGWQFHPPGTNSCQKGLPGESKSLCKLGQNLAPRHHFLIPESNWSNWVRLPLRLSPKWEIVQSNHRYKNLLDFSSNLLKSPQYFQFCSFQLILFILSEIFTLSLLPDSLAAPRNPNPFDPQSNPVV